MAFKSKKVATCPCGTGDTHSLRQSAICDGLRNGHISQVEATKRLEALQVTNDPRNPSMRRNANAEAPTPESPAEV